MAYPSFSRRRYAMLAAAARPGIAVLAGHSGPVYSVAFSPDGKTLASASYDGTVRLWDVATGRQIRQLLTGHREPVLVAFSPTANTLATGSFGGTVRLWDVATGRQISHPFGGDTGPVVSLAFSPNGKTLASTSLPRRLPELAHFHGTVRLWDVATGRQIREPLVSHSGTVESVTFGSDGKTLASGSGDGTVQLWDVATGRQIREPLVSHSGTVYSVAFSPDGKTLATASGDGTVRLWDVATGRPTSRTLAGPAEALWPPTPATAPFSR